MRRTRSSGSRIDYAMLPVDGTSQQTSTALLAIPGFEAETRCQLGAYLEDESLLDQHCPAF